jgi:N-methylhydantoinase A
LRLDPDAAGRALQQTCARAAGLDVVTAAQGIVEIANASMVGAIRLVSVQRGHDPRDFALLAFGGAGPLHANALADAMAIPTTVVPPEPGVASAVGLLLADLAHDFMRTHVTRLAGVDLQELTRIYGGFEREGTEVIAGEALAARVRFVRTMDLRYVGQSYELRIPVPDGALEPAHLSQIAEQFHAEHQRSYGFAAPEEPVELVNIRLTAVGEVGKPQSLRAAEAPATTARPRTTRRVFFSETGFVDTPVFDRDEVARGHHLAGPAIVEQDDSTTVIHPGYAGVGDPTGNILICRQAHVDAMLAKTASSAGHAGGGGDRK